MKGRINMKRAERIVSYLLVLALVTTLLSGLGYAKSDVVEVKAAGNTLNVLEIVPTSEMATFGYMVKSWTDSNFASKAGAIGNYSNFKTYIQNAGLGTVSSSSLASTDYFKTQVLGLAADDALAINVTTKTPNDSDLISAVNNADFIVINQTVPSALRYGTQKKFSDDGYRFTNAQVLAIFKKVAGVEGQTPVPYIIDGSLLNKSAFVDVRNLNSAFLDKSGGHSGSVGYTRADTMYNGQQGIGVGQGQAWSISTASNDTAYNGSGATNYKLFKLLSSIDPATLYGLYFRENDGGYGIDRDLNIIGLGPDANGNTNQVQGSLYRLNTKMSAWPDVLFRPNYLTTGSRNVSTVMGKMGWFEAGSGNYLKIIGGADGRGVAYSSSDGLFYATEAVTGSSGVDLSSFVDIGSKVTVSYEGNNDYGKINIKNNTSETLTNWKVTFEKDGYIYETGNDDWRVDSVDNGDSVTLYCDKSASQQLDIGPNTTVSQVTQGKGISSNKNLNTVSIAAASGSKVGTVVNSFRISASTKNDYHPYRLLMVTDNTPDSYANRTVIAELVAAANEAGKGLPEGIIVECVSKPEFDNISVDLNQTYDMICVVGTLTGGSIGADKLSHYTGTKVTGLTSNNPGSITTIVNSFKNNIFGHKIGVNYVTVPNEYYTDFIASFAGENGDGVYQGVGNANVPENANYINDNSHPGKRTLDFQFKVTGAPSFTAKLYVDVDGDFKYEEDEVVTLSSSNNTLNSIPLSDPNFFGEGGADYVGGFSWKLVISSSAGTVSRIGYSAIRNETTNKSKIKILQIYPTDYKDGYNQENSPHPLLILPTKSEIAAAESLHGNISHYSINDLSTNNGIPGIQVHFKESLKIDKADTFNDERVGDVQNKTIDYSGGRKSIITDAGYLYYFLNELQDYDIDVTRYSVSAFNEAAGKDVVLDMENGRLSKSGGDPVKNLDGSTRYVYKPQQLSFTDNAWKSLTVTWTEGVFKKYLVDDSTGYIYGERGDADGSVRYYRESESDKSGSGSLVYGVDKDNEFDIVMIGFGSTLDYMNNTAINLLKDYLSGGGPAFIGNGAVSKQGFNTFGNNETIKSLIGISQNTNSGYAYAHNTVLPIITTNDTVFSHYPYTINPVMKASGDGVPPYKLELTGSVNDPIVAFTKYRQGEGTEGSWGNALTNYYVYKKNNITYCGFGATFNDPTGGQLGNYLPMAETLMIVNALVASSRFGSSPIHSNPYFDCKDDDASVLNVTGLEDDQVETNTDGDTIWYFKDSVYTDYDAYDIAAFAKDDAQRKFNSPVQNSGLGIPGVNVTADGWTSNIRWIPYLADIPTEAGGYIEFKTVNGATTLNLKVWSVANNAFVTPEDGKYHVNRNGMYYIGVPLNGGHSAYAGASKLGFMIDKDNPDNSIDMFAIRMNLYKPNKTVLVERHTISMIRRVLYHAK